jgi:hypothetical protein
MSDLRAELEAIKAKEGRLTPRLVLETAKDKAHPLHSRFEWDNAVCGERYRLIQAQDLITQVKVTYTTRSGESRSVRGFHAIRATDADEYEYDSGEDVLADPFKRKVVLRDMERQVNELVARFEHFQEFWALMRKVSRRKAG